MTAAGRQAALFRARKRRRSRAALPLLHQTRFVEIGGPFPDALTIVRDADRPVTFKTRIICDGVPNGPLLTIGSSATGLFFVGGKLQAKVNGAAVVSDFTFAAGVRFDIAFAIIPGTGRFRAYIESTETLDGQTTPGAYVTTGDLTLSDAGVILDDGLRVYALHVPQGMVGSSGGAATPTFDDILFRATAHLMGGDQFTPTHFPSA